MFTIGIDFGTQSGRVLLVDARSGAEVASIIQPYANGVIDKYLPHNGKLLPPDWALQDPYDYLKVLELGVPAVLQLGRVNPNNVVGLAIRSLLRQLYPLPVTEHRCAISINGTGTLTPGSSCGNTMRRKHKLIR